MAQNADGQRERLKSLLQEKLADTQTQVGSMLIPIRDEGSSPTLYCVHGGGTGLAGYKRLASKLQSDQRIYGLQLTGATPGDLIVKSVEKMAELHLATLQDFDSQGPYIFCGHSLSGLVALELGQLLTKAGKQVALVIIIDQPGPDIRFSWRHWLFWQWATLYKLNWKQRSSYLTDKIRFRFGTAKWLPNFVRRQFLGGASSPNNKDTSKIQNSPGEYRRQWFETTLKAVQDYSPSPYSQPMVLFRTALSAPKIHSDPNGGWGGIGGDRFHVFDVPGHHMNVFDEPFIGRFAETFDKCLTMFLSRDQPNISD